MMPPRYSLLVASFAILFSCSRLLAEQPATAPAVAPPISGKLGTPIQLFNGKDILGWTWVMRAPKASTQPVALTGPWSVRNGLLHSDGKPVGYLRTPDA